MTGGTGALSQGSDIVDTGDAAALHLQLSHAAARSSALTLRGSPLLAFSPEVPAVVPVVDVDRFYRELIEELGEFARKGGTGIGAAAVVKRVGLAHGIGAAEWVQVPRLTRAEQQELGVAGASWRRAKRGRS